MSRCQGQDPAFMPPGIPDFKPEHDFPTRFTNFHWWGKIASDKVCYKSIRRDELPIPPIHDERWRYPYRYSSAGPSPSGVEWFKRQKEVEREDKEPVKMEPRVMEPRDIRQVKGYETTSMDMSLEPFLYHAPTVIIRKETPPSLLTPIWAPKCAHTEFGKHILGRLHPNYRTDPRIKKRLQFPSVDSNRELCVTSQEVQHLENKPQKKVKKKDFSFVHQRPGHRPASESMPTPLEGDQQD